MKKKRRSLRRRLVIAGCILLGLPVLLLSSALLYLNLADLGRYRGSVESLLSTSLGRELTISELDLEFGWTTSLEARGITLANPEWSSDPAMVRVERLSIRLDLWSLLSGPIRIHELRVGGARVLLESDGEGRATWQFDLPEGEKSDGPSSSPPELVLEHVLLEDLAVVYRDPSQERPLELSEARLEIRAAADDMLALAFGGRLNEAPVSLEGTVGPLGGILRARDLEVDVVGTAAGANWTLKGGVADLGTLAGTEAIVEARGDDLAEVGRGFGLPSIGEGPFHLNARLSPASEKYGFSVDAAFGGVTLRAEGGVDSLLDPASLDVTLDASGPDLAAVGRLAGLEPLPAEVFDVKGRVHWEGFPMAFDEVRARVGDNRLSLDGVLGAPPAMRDTDFLFRTEGPDLAAFSGLATIDLPPGPFRASGRLQRVEQGIRVDELEARVGETTMEVDGLVGDPPEFEGTTLAVHVSGPALSEFEGLAGIELPAEAFEVRGGLEYTGGGIVLDEVRASLGDSRAQVSGKLHTTEGLVGTEVSLHGAGDDLAQIGLLAGRSDWPDDPFSVEAALRVLPDGYALDSAKLHLADVVLEAAGHVGPPPEVLGTDLRVDVRGPDLSWVGRLADEELPGDAFRVTGVVRVDDDGYELESVDATIGEVAVRLDGRVGSPPELYGTQLTADVRGPRLAALGAYADRPLPEIPFAVSGKIAIDETGYRLDDTAAQVGENRIALDGLVAPSETLAGTSVRVDVAGPGLAALGRLAAEAGIDELPGLPEDPYSVVGNLAIDEAGYRLQAVEVGLGRGVVRLDGRVGRPPEFLGTEMSIDARGRDGSRLGPFVGRPLPADPYRVRGRVEVQESGYAFHDLRLEYGEYRAGVNGTLGEPPKMAGTRLDVSASGPGLVTIGEIAGRPGLPDEPFEVAGHFEGTPEWFSMREFSARLGASDLRGSFRVDLREIPDIQGEFQSNHLDLSPFVGAEEGDGEMPVEVEEPEIESVADPEALLLSDEPFDLEALREVHADVDIRFGEFVVAPLVVRDVHLGLHLRDGGARVDPLSGAEEFGATFAGRFALEPVGEDYRAQAVLRIENFKVDMTDGKHDASRWPSVDVDLDLWGTGRSPHTLASDLNGHLQLIVTEGVINNSLLEVLATDLIFKLFSTLNPFAKNDPTTALDCFVLATNIRDGETRLDPIVMRTNKMVMLGNGEIEFAGESIDLEWVTKPRKGIGISVGAFTNALIKLGGTLADPKIQSKGIEGAAKGSLSMVTLGIADRITAERKFCKKALKQVARQAETRAAAR